MGLFGTFVARKLGYMRSSLSNRDLNRLISDKISELDKDEQNAEDALKQKLYHTITHKFNLQLQTIETIDFYLKVKTVRIMEQNKHAMQEIKNEISHSLERRVFNYLAVLLNLKRQENKAAFFQGTIYIKEQFIPFS